MKEDAVFVHFFQALINKSVTAGSIYYGLEEEGIEDHHLGEGVSSSTKS